MARRARRPAGLGELDDGQSGPTLLRLARSVPTTSDNSGLEVEMVKSLSYPLALIRLLATHEWGRSDGSAER